MRRVLFYRDFRQFTGGHLKVWHYFNHVRSSPDHDAWIRFSSQTVWDETNPWTACADRVLPPRTRFEPDIVFLAGLDWLSLKPRERRRPPWPIVNLIQHVRHALVDDPRFPFLSHPAVRICVSPEVTEAIVSTGKVNGPVFTVPEGIDIPPSTAARSVRDIDVLVVATKQPELARRLEPRLRQLTRSVNIVAAPIRRQELLGWMRQARVTVFLPNRTEGFYLPALEGMALGTVVVCPDCVGNRSFCLAGVNCFRPDYDEQRIADAVDAALASSAAARELLVKNAAATASEHSLERERSEFLRILSDVSRDRTP